MSRQRPLYRVKTTSLEGGGFKVICRLDGLRPPEARQTFPTREAAQRVADGLCQDAAMASTR